MKRSFRAAASVVLATTGLSFLTPVALAAPAPATNPKAFCSKVVAYNTSFVTAAKKAPNNRLALTNLRVQGWTNLAKSAPPAVATGLRNMAASVKAGFPPAQADMAAALGYIETTCKVRLA